MLFQKKWRTINRLLCSTSCITTLLASIRLCGLRQQWKRPFPITFGPWNKLSVCCLDLTKKHAHHVRVKREIIKAFLFGILMTFLGYMLLIIDEAFFPSSTLQTATGIDFCLLVMAMGGFWLFLVVPNAVNISPYLFDQSNMALSMVFLVVTVVFWACLVYFLGDAKRKAARKRQISKS